MKIKWNGHSSFTIKSGDGVVIITDPYEPGAYGGTLKYSAIRDTADIATVSHEHPDHSFVKGLSGKPEVVKSSRKIKGIDFTAIEVFHGPTGGSQRGKNNIYVFTVDKIKLCHLGDLGHPLTKEQMASIGHVDVLFIPVGGTFTIDPNQAVTLIGALDPKIVIPMHYKTEKCGFQIAKLDDFIHGKEKITKIIGKSELELTKDGLPVSQEIWILEHAC